MGEVNFEEVMSDPELILEFLETLINSMLIYIGIAVVLGIICLIVTCAIAKSKNKDTGVWFLLALSFGWFATIVVAISPAQKMPTPQYVTPIVPQQQAVAPTVNPVIKANQTVAPTVAPTPVATPVATPTATAYKPQLRYYNPYARFPSVNDKKYNSTLLNNTATQTVAPTVKPVTPTPVVPVQPTATKPVAPVEQPNTNVYGTPVAPKPTTTQPKKEEPEEVECWQCSACGMMNEEPSRFCNNCGCKRS